MSRSPRRFSSLRCCSGSQRLAVGQPSRRTALALTLLLSLLFALSPSASHAQTAGQGQGRGPARGQTTLDSVPKLNPKQQVVAFYGLCKQNQPAEALDELLGANPFIAQEALQEARGSFARIANLMGAFIDYQVVRERKPSKRTHIIECMAHFETQPFLMEFVFYDPGQGHWRLVHFRYDAKLGTMFEEKGGAEEAPAAR